MAIAGNVRPYALVLSVIAAVFIVFFFGGFLFFWQYAMDLREENSSRALGFALTDGQFQRMRLVFWLLYGGMIAAALASGTAAGWPSHLSPRAIALTVLPAVAVLGLLSFPFLEFQNACNVGDSFLIRSYC